ncbi:MAG TPA: GNAT family N-acetyltransferase [Clostridia bacterium]
MNTHLTTITDWQKYKSIRLQALKDTPQAFGQTYDDAAKKTDSHWKEVLSQENRFFVITEINGEAVSVAGAKQIADDTWFIIAVYTKPEFRGKGIAKETMRTVLDELKKRKIKKAELWVNVDQEAAIALYKNLGFSIVKTISDQKMGDGLLHEEYVMEKALD